MDKFTEKLADIVFKFLPRRFVLPLFILGIFPAVWNAYEPFLPDGVPRWVPLALDGLLFFLALLKWRVPPESPPAGGRYFIGPRAYTEGETERFFGRPAAIDTCVAALQVHPFFILEAESGCGKSSLVYAGLIPKLQKTFFIEVMRCTNGREERIWPVSSENAAQQRPRLVFYDQFEELFTTAKDTERAAFLQKLREALNRGERRVCLVIRQDFYDLLRRLCETVDPDAQTLKYQRYYTLEPFDSTTALGVLSKLTELPETDPFLTTLVGDLLRPPREAKLSSEDTKTVLPVELQTVGSVLDHVGLRQADYATAGGKVGLLRRFLEDATAHVYRISRVPPEASLRLLRALISDAKTNAPKTIGEIHALYPGFSKPVIRKIMDAFAERWLVRQVPRDGLEEPPYEFVHEHLILALDEAPTPALIREREAQERLAFWIERSDAAFQPLPAKRTRRQQLVRWFAAPIPLVETFVLWKRASTIQRRELRRSLNGWMRILVSLAIAAGVLFAGPYYYTRTWRYQLDAMVQSAPLNTATEISVTHYLRMLTWARPL
jgi:hypothetical protein